MCANRLQPKHMWGKTCAALEAAPDELATPSSGAVSIMWAIIVLGAYPDHTVGGASCDYTWPLQFANRVERFDSHKENRASGLRLGGIVISWWENRVVLN